MRISERTARLGRLLSRNKKRLPFLFIVCALLALVCTTPFHISTLLWIDIVSYILVVVAFALMMLSSRREGRTFEKTVLAGGIYSAMRFPGYAAHGLMMVAISLYSGVMWFFALTLIAVIATLEKIIGFEEEAMAEKYGERYLEWCRRTNALLPVMAHWRPSVSGKGFFVLASEQFSPMLYTFLGFMAVDLVRSFRVYFLPGDFFLVAFVFSLFMLTLIAKLFSLRNKKTGK